MNIPWKLKSRAFRAIDNLNATSLLYWLQTNVTRRARKNLTVGSANWKFLREHIASLGRPKVFEFGAGKSLQQNLYLSSFVSSQTLIDLFPMLDLRLADAAARGLATLTDGRPYQPIGRIEDLKHYGIIYRAPCDAAATGFTAGCFDACISTDTLEHIPPGDLLRIFVELMRILRSGGLVSAVIDYSDHYAHTDASISRLNFLQFSENEFALHNHSVHYQNRMRHGDYLALFKQVGFEVLKEMSLNHIEPPVRISAQFSSDDPNTFATKGIFLLRNP